MAMDPPRAIKKRKLHDKNLPFSILQSPEFAESKFYQDLLDMERKLDWTISRKKVEIQDALGKPAQITRTLRIFLSHTVSDQIWQTGLPGDQLSMESGKGIPSWALKIEGRLLEVPTRSRHPPPARKFSTLLKSLVVDMDRDPTLYPDGNIVEWHRPQAAPSAAPPALDGFTIRRMGDTQTRLRIILHLEHYPEQWKVAPELGNIIGVKQDSRTGVITALWNYIKINNLQDKTERRLIRTDAPLKLIFGGDSLAFQQIPELVNRFLQPPDPVILNYVLRPTEVPPAVPQAWDAEIIMEDTSFKSRMNQVIVNTSTETARDLVKYEEECTILATSIHNSQLKRNFLNDFAANPPQFIQTWLESQSRDLESVLGTGPSEGHSVREEELKRSEFFRLPWVEEAVAIQEGVRLNTKAAAMAA